MTPNYDSALNEEAGRLLLESQDDFARQAALFTRIHASHRPTEFAILASTSVAPTKSSIGSSKDLSCGTRSASPQPVPFPQTMPLQESASGNGATPQPIPIDVAGKKRTISNALGSTTAPGAMAAEPKTKSVPAAKKRGLKRL